MWFGAPFVCFQILLVQKQWTWRWLDLPWWALSIPKWEARLNWFRLCQAFEDSWAGNRGCRNLEFAWGGGTLIFTSIHPVFFLAPNLGWNYLWDEHGPLKPPSAGFFGPGCLPVSPCSTCCHRKLRSYVGQRALCGTTRGACSSQVCQANLFEKCPSFMRSNCQDA